MITGTEVFLGEKLVNSSVYIHFLARRNCMFAKFFDKGWVVAVDSAFDGWHVRCGLMLEECIDVEV